MSFLKKEEKKERLRDSEKEGKTYTNNKRDFLSILHVLCSSKRTRLDSYIPKAKPFLTQLDSCIPKGKPFQKELCPIPTLKGKKKTSI